MAVKVYDKLVRDKVPDVIRQSGALPRVRTLDDAAYMEALRAKLREEVDEFLESGSLEELVDVGEVMHALLAQMGVSVERFQQARSAKLEQHGGFGARLFLMDVTQPG